MTTFINFHPKFYVGLRAEDDFVPLGFATPFGEDKAFQNRKSTVDNWASGYYYQKKKNLESITFENKPVSGFTFDRSVSRWTTSNKWFRIIDPRGFMLEIAADNLAEIILNSEIDRGDIQGTFVWGRIGSVNYLINVNDQRYIDFLTPKEEYTPQIGNKIAGFKVGGIYIGDFYVHYLTYVYPEEKDRYRLHSPRRSLH